MIICCLAAQYVTKICLFFRFSGVFIFWMSMLFHKNSPVQDMFTNPIFHGKRLYIYFFLHRWTICKVILSILVSLGNIILERAAAALRRALTQSGEWNVTANLRLHLFSSLLCKRGLKKPNRIRPLVQMKHDWLRAPKPKPPVHSKVRPSHRQKCTRSQTSQESHKQAHTDTLLRVPSPLCHEFVI